MTKCIVKGAHFPKSVCTVHWFLLNVHKVYKLHLEQWRLLSPECKLPIRMCTPTIVQFSGLLHLILFYKKIQWNFKMNKLTKRWFEPYSVWRNQLEFYANRHKFFCQVMFFNKTFMRDSLLVFSGLLVFCVNSGIPITLWEHSNTSVSSVEVGALSLSAGCSSGISFILFSTSSS